MAKQALTATAQIVLPEKTDVFEGVKRAEAARNILLQAQAEIQKTFPDFVFAFSAGAYRDPNAKPRGRRPGSTNASATNGAAGDTAGTAPAAAGADKSGGKGNQPSA